MIYSDKLCLDPGFPMDEELLDDESEKVGMVPEYE